MIVYGCTVRKRTSIVSIGLGREQVALTAKVMPLVPFTMVFLGIPVRCALPSRTSHVSIATRRATSGVPSAPPEPSFAMRHSTNNCGACIVDACQRRDPVARGRRDQLDARLPRQLRRGPPAHVRLPLRVRHGHVRYVTYIHDLYL